MAAQIAGAAVPFLGPGLISNRFGPLSGGPAVPFLEGGAN
jgi:hypothetical protein